MKIDDKVRVKSVPYVNETGIVVRLDTADLDLLGIMYLVKLDKVQDAHGQPMQVWYTRKELEHI